MSEKKSNILKKAGETAENILAPRLISGTVEEIKPHAKLLTNNFKELWRITKNSFRKNEQPTINSEEYDGKAHFRQIMIENGITEDIYLKTKDKMFTNHWIYLLVYLISSIFLAKMAIQGEYLISGVFFLVFSVTYIRFSKEASEFREQEFLSLKEFFSYPTFWFPSQKQTNGDYFVVTKEMLSNEEEQIDIPVSEQDINDYKEWKEFQQFKAMQKQQKQQENNQ